MNIKKGNIWIIILIGLIFMSGCQQTFTPKPRGYFRIDLPEKKYKKTPSSLPYQFKYPVYSEYIPDKSKGTKPYWADIYFPRFNAKIHISYYLLTENKDEFYEDCRELVVKHTEKADALNEKTYEKPTEKVYGILYEIKGNVASSLQFYLTDSTNNFLRGALYFNNRPNKDSIAPVIDFLKKDIIYMIESFSWNEIKSEESILFLKNYTKNIYKKHN